MDYATQLLKVKGGVIAFNGSPFQSYGTLPAIWNPTVLPAIWQVNAPHLTPSQIGQCPIYLPQRVGRLSWSRRLVSYWDGLSVRRHQPSNY